MYFDDVVLLFDFMVYHDSYLSSTNGHSTLDTKIKGLTLLKDFESSRSQYPE